MYYSTDSDQLVIEDFVMPFGGALDPQNRWVRLAGIMPWDHIEQIYLESMSVEAGRRALPSRVAFGAIYIKESENLSDEGCVTAIRENPYISVVDGYTFLEQTGWSNFNEGCDLQAAVEDFHRKFGHYPEAVLRNMGSGCPALLLAGRRPGKPERRKPGRCTRMPASATQWKAETGT